MANVNSISSSNSYSSTSSIYGNRNILSGLASGMDTESMIQNSVSGYQTKITQLQQQQEQLTWKQDAYRTITDQLIALSEKYTSYSSSTNLASNAFFSRAVTTTTNGVNAGKVSATGKATSDIQINAVTQLATAAKYAVSADALNFSDDALGAIGSAINWNPVESSTIANGYITLRVGNSDVDIDFDAEDIYHSTQELVDGINAKLSEQNANAKAVLEGNKITFQATDNSGDSVYISQASANVKKTLGVDPATSSASDTRFEHKSFTVGDASSLYKTESAADYLSGKTLNVTLDGTSKTITIGDLTGMDMSQFSAYDEKIIEIENKLNNHEYTSELSVDESMQQLKADLDAARDERTAAINAKWTEMLAEDIQKGMDTAFGRGKVTVAANAGALSFDVAENSGSTLLVGSSAGEVLGIGKNGVTNYLNTGKKLGALLGETELNGMRMAASGEVDKTARYFDKDGNELTQVDGKYYRLNSNGTVMTKDGEKVAGTFHHSAFTDEDGNLVKQLYDDNQYYRVNEKGEFLYDLVINDVSVGQFSKESALEEVMSAINNSTEAGVSVSYSNLTGQFVFSARETGANGQIKFGEGLASRLFEVNNQPSTLKASDFLGNVQWDADGNAWLDFNPPSTAPGEYMFQLNKNDTIETMVTKINETVGSSRNVTFQYDAATGEYGVYDKNGNPVSGDNVTITQWNNKYADTQLSAPVTLGSIAESANNLSAYTAGQDAKLTATVNGQEISLTRSSNTVSMDGLTVTLKGTFQANTDDEAVTFTTNSDADKIVSTVKDFVEAYNAVLKDVHDAYATRPATDSKGNKYNPLSEDDKASMTETAIKNYEEKAKTGLLFGDSDLSSLYNKLRSIATASDLNLSSIGITTTYSEGVTQLSIDEDKLRGVLESDPDKVRNIFTRTKESGAASDGLMARFSSVYKTYASKSYGSYGILVNKAGTKLASLSLMNNSLQKQISNLDTQIDKWQEKLSLKIDYYTKQFTALEQLMSTMNNQSSMLADLMGY